MAENKFREINRIFKVKRKYVDKNKEIKDIILDLELIEHRYRIDVDHAEKGKKRNK